MTYLAQEVWDKVVDELSTLPISARNASQVFGFKLKTHKTENHTRVWNTIFQDEAWGVIAREAGLNPTLVGSNLQHYYNRRTAGAGSVAYICIWCKGNYHHRYHFLSKPENKQLFFQCLQPHSFDKSTKEIRLDCGITLNVSAILNSQDDFVNVRPQRVVTYRSYGFRSCYLLWEDETHDLRRLDSLSKEKNLSSAGGYHTTEMIHVMVKIRCDLKICDAEGSHELLVLYDQAESQRNQIRLESFNSNEKARLSTRVAIRDLIRRIKASGGVDI